MERVEAFDAELEADARDLQVSGGRGWWEGEQLAPDAQNAIVCGWARANASVACCRCAGWGGLRLPAGPPSARLCA